MAQAPFTQQNQGQYIPMSQIWDIISQLQSTDIKSDQFKELLVRLAQYVGFISLATNNKETGTFPLQEFVTGAQWFNQVQNQTPNRALRSEYRSVFNIGALGAGVTTVAHNFLISSTWTFTDIYGVASDTAGNNYYPLPFASAGGANNIELRVNATNIVITNNSGVTFSTCYVVLEYLKY